MKKRFTWICCVLFFGFHVSPTIEAAELQPRLREQGIGISLLGLPFPETLPRDLSSGFENRLVIQVTVSIAGKVIDRRDAIVVVKYDLWDEHFAVQSGIANGASNRMTIKQVSEVMQYLNNLHFDGLFPIMAQQANQDLLLRADVSINPIEREKIERVRQWVTSNSVPSGAVVANSGAALVTPQPNDLFNKIFDQYIRGENVVADWKHTITSKPFRSTQTGVPAK